MDRLPLFTEFEIEAEIERMGLLQKRSMGWYAIAHRSKRFAIRTVRILFAIALACIAYAVSNHSLDILGMPISSISMLQIISGICGVGLALCIAIVAWKTAFGAGPTPEDYEMVARHKALASLTVKHPVGLSIKTVDFSVDHTGYQMEK